ncbi:MAG: LysE family translocator [Bacteroidetes bacterium]|nr:LysE family translocator [Bacteroidota bacterium]
MLAPLIFGLGTGFVMSISLGAVFFLLIQAGLAGGWRKGLPLALGVIVGDMIYVTLALHFSEAINESLVSYRSKIALCGALVFWILAVIHIFHHQKAKSNGIDERLMQMKDWQLWLKSFAINVLNPVNIAWWLSLYSLPPAADFTYSGKWLFGITTLATVFCTELGVAWGAGKIKNYLTEARIRQIDLFLAVLFFGMGVYLMTV